MNFLHKTPEILPVGVRLAQLPEVIAPKIDLHVFKLLEASRPPEQRALSCSAAVFRIADDMEACGYCTGKIYIVRALGQVSRHDSGWIDRIRVEIEGQDRPAAADLLFYTSAFWSGMPQSDTPLWLYLLKDAEVIHRVKQGVAPDDVLADFDLMERDLDAQRHLLSMSVAKKA